MLRWAWSSNLVYNAPYLGLRVQRSLILSSVPTLRRKKGHRRQKQASLYPSYASTWIVYGYELLILLLIPTLWKSFWVWEACFVADTHAMKSFWVWEACFVADTQIMKTGRYNKGIIYFRMPVAGVRGGYGNPTLRAMQSIHKCVAKDAPHLFHWRLSSVSVGRTV